MHTVSDTFLYTLGHSDVLQRLEARNDCRILFLNAQDGAFVRAMRAKGFHIDCVQWSKDFYDPLEDLGVHLRHAIDYAQRYDAVFCIGTKQKLEARFMIAAARAVLKEDGIFIIGAPNSAGGKILKKDCKTAGFTGESISKHKNTAVVSEKDAGANSAIHEEWLSYAVLSYRDETAFFTHPGLYGWKKIDQGSRLLVETLAEEDITLSQNGADFGSGYGYLARSILEKYPKITGLRVIDADARAIIAAEKNLETYCDDDQAGQNKINFIWADIARASISDLCDKRLLDFVIMNPPFHVDKKTSVSLGGAFIHKASACLRNKGHLYMVANTHLPYEAILKECFASVEILKTADGFKVIRAQKSGS